MDWQQLKSFYTIVKLGNMTRAAEAMFRTQSALSQQINKLESDLDCVLFNRVGKSNFHLTDAGEALYQFAEQTFLRERDLLQRLEEINNVLSGAVHLAAPFAVLEFLLGDIICDFKRTYPKIALHIFDKSPQACIDMVTRGSVDLAFVHDSTIPTALKRHAWKTGHYTFAAPKGHPLTELREPGLQDFLRYPLNLPSPHAKFSAREKLDRRCYELGLKYRVSLETPNILLNIGYTLRDVGVSFILSYDKMIRDYSDRLVFFTLPDIFPDETISLIHRGGGNMTQHAEAFLDVVLSN